MAINAESVHKPFLRWSIHLITDLTMMNIEANVSGIKTNAVFVPAKYLRAKMSAYVIAAEVKKIVRSVICKIR